MELDGHLVQVQNQLAATAALGDERTREVAEALMTAAVPAMRLAIQSALGAVAAEITVALLDSPGAPRVAVRLDGDEIRVDVTSGRPEAPAPRPDDSDANARVSLRLPESLKADVEQAASRDGVSVNTWLVRATAAALDTGWSDFGGTADVGSGRGGQGARRGPTSHHVSGWIN
jgi:hypothetical protein